MTKPIYDAMMLRTCNADMTSYGGFRWPKRGPVKCLDWNPRPVCGGGLHGLLWGQGGSKYLDWSEDAVWQVVKIVASEAVSIDNKIKVPRGHVVYSGTREAATQYLYRHAPAGTVIHGLILSGGVGATVTGGAGATVTGGAGATVTGGDRATVTGGDRATVTGGDWATVTGGAGATVTGGDRATVTGGDWATVTGGYWATVTGGYRATVTGGDWATVTGGDRATVTGGYRATVTGGAGATVTGGDRATVTGGDRATLSLRWHCGTRYRIAVGYVGEDGIEANVAYRCEAGKLVKA